MVALLWIAYFGIWMTGTTMYVKNMMTKNIAIILSILSGIVFISLAIVDTRTLIISTMCCLFAGASWLMTYSKSLSGVKGIFGEDSLI